VRNQRIQGVRAGMRTSETSAQPVRIPEMTPLPQAKPAAVCR